MHNTGRIVLLFLAGVLAFAQRSAQPQPLGSMVDAGGYHVHLYCTGEGSPAVIVVGGAFSFDWALIQPEVAKYTRICTYDPSGTAWSEVHRFRHDGADDSPRCVDRVSEIHAVLKSARVSGPYVLVGFSIGGLVARLYTNEYPGDVSGMVIVDHAFIDVDSDAAVQPPAPQGPPFDTVRDSPPVLISSTPITLGFEDDRNFAKLPQRMRDLHAWAMSIHPLRPTVETAAECFATVRDKGDGAYPLGDTPLVVIRTNNDLPAYQRLQASLLLLSRDSEEILAQKSSHMVLIDEPEAVIRGVREVVKAARKGTPLKRE